MVPAFSSSVFLRLESDDVHCGAIYARSFERHTCSQTWINMLWRQLIQASYETLLPIFSLRVRFCLYLGGIYLLTHGNSDSWSIVTLAFFLRYPNPYASHVISCDVISRDQTPSGSLVTTRLILKQGAMPRWFPKGIVSRAESWVVEESEVDPYGKLVRCVTKNLDHVKVMQVEESVQFSQTMEGFVLALSTSFSATYSLLSTQKNSATHPGKNCV